MNERTPIWATVLICLGIFALLTLLVGGPAVGWFARGVQYALGFVGLITLIGGVMALWIARRDGRTFGSGRRAR